MKSIAERTTHRFGVEKYTEVFIIRVGIFTKSWTYFEFFIFYWWYHDCESFCTSFHARKILKKLEVYFIEPSGFGPFFISNECNTLKAIFLIQCSFTEYIGSWCDVGFGIDTSISDSCDGVRFYDRIREYLDHTRIFLIRFYLYGITIFCYFYSIQKESHFFIWSTFSEGIDRGNDIISFYTSSIRPDSIISEGTLYQEHICEITIREISRIDTTSYIIAYQSTKEKTIDEIRSGIFAILEGIHRIWHSINHTNTDTSTLYSLVVPSCKNIYTNKVYTEEE